MRVLAALLMLLICAGPAYAHVRSQSQSRWTVEGDALDMRLEAEALDVTRLYALGGDAPLADTLAQEVRQAFAVSAAGASCSPAGEPRAHLAEGGRVIATWRFTCPAGALARGPVTIESRLFERVAPTHLHFVALRGGEGGAAEAVLSAQRSRAELDLTAAPEQRSFWDTVGRFLPVGAEHVWSGLDHVAFILALVLLTAGRLGSVILAATGFTVGHTITLGLAAVGVLRPDESAVEALIGFTIAFVALSAGGEARVRASSRPIALALAAGGAGALAGVTPMSPLVWFGLAAFVYAYPRGFPREAAWVALVFGLIHGCGFAGALAELDLPRPRLLASLLGFNIGVEFGQVVVIAGALLIGLAARRLPERVRAEAAPAAGAALLALGTYWFVGRLFA
jgi:hypothetical protein